MEYTRRLGEAILGVQANYGRDTKDVENAITCSRSPLISALSPPAMLCLQDGQTRWINGSKQFMEAATQAWEVERIVNAI